MTPTLGGPIDETFFARYNATVQAALSSSNNTYVILDVVRPFWNDVVPGAVSNWVLYSITTPDGMEALSAKAGPPTISLQTYGPKLQPNMLMITG